MVYYEIKYIYILSVRYSFAPVFLKLVVKNGRDVTMRLKLELAKPYFGKTKEKEILRNMSLRMLIRL